MGTTNKDHQAAIGNAFYNAYTSVAPSCTQNGAHCEMYDAKFAAEDNASNTFLLRTASFCNAWKPFNGDAEQCGIELYIEDSGTPVSGLRNLQVTADGPPGGAICSCEPPKESDVLAAFNTAMVALVNTACTPTTALTTLD